MKLLHLLSLTLCLAFSIGYAEWAHNARQGDIAYFFFSSPAKIERYDLLERQWLEPRFLPSERETLTAVALDADGIFVAYGRSVFRYDLEGENEQHIINLNSNVRDVLTDGNFLFLTFSRDGYARAVSIDKGSHQVIDAYEGYASSMQAAVIMPSSKRIIGTRNWSPGGFTQLQYDEDGHFVAGWSGSSGGGARVWAWPGERYFVNSHGAVFNTRSHAHVSGLEMQVNDLSAEGENFAVVRSGQQLLAFNMMFQPTGSVALSRTPRSILVHGEEVLMFAPGEAGIEVDVVSLAELNVPAPGQPVDPATLPLRPDTVFTDSEGVLHMFSKGYPYIFRWDVEAQHFLSTLELANIPEDVAYSAANHTIYLLDHAREVLQVNLADPEPSEAPFATFTGYPSALQAAGPYLFVADLDGNSMSHHSFAPDGSLVASVRSTRSREFVWSEANQKMYFLSQFVSPVDLFWQEINADGVTYPHLAPGGFGNRMDSPLHNSAGFTPPVRVSPDGSMVVLGSGGDS